MRDFFRCAAHLVVTIYDLLLASILGICGSDGSVAYPFPYIYYDSEQYSSIDFQEKTYKMFIR